MLVFGILIVEAAIRLYPQILSDELIVMLPEEARARIAADRGFFVRDQITGHDMLFYRTPSAEILNKPWIKIDQNGYRNISTPNNQVDVVLLGASVVDALDVKEDLPALFNKEGASVYSLAMGGYGPYHYRDSYIRYIVEPGIKHSAVVILIITPYDLHKAESYRRILKNGGDYLSFFTPPSVLSTTFPGTKTFWTLSILSHLPQHIIGKLRAARSTEFVNVKLDWLEMPIAKSSFSKSPKHTGWEPLSDALQQVIALAKSNGAVPYVVNYPNVSVRLLPFVQLDMDTRAAFESHVTKTTAQLEKIVTEAGGQFIDITEPFRAQTQKEPITVDPTNYHLNQQGMNLLFQTLESSILPALNP